MDFWKFLGVTLAVGGVLLIAVALWPKEGTDAS